MKVLKKVLQSNYLLLCVFFVFILFSYYRINLNVDSFYEGDELEFRLKLIDKKYKNNQFLLTFIGKEKLISYSNDCPYDVGDIIIVKGNLSKPNNNTIPNTFNYRNYLQSRGISWELKISEFQIIEKNSSIFYKLKKLINDKIDNYEYKEYLYSFVLGDSSYFNNEKRNIYEACGLSYLISIGSLQVMMLIRLLKKIEGKLKINNKKSLIINSIVIIIYILFTKKTIGVLRSGLCFILSCILKYYKIKYKYYNILFIIGSILLIFNPYYIVNSGFLYSFTISIIISINLEKIKGNYFKRLLHVSMIAFIASIPITIYFNYEINFLAVIYCIFFVPVFHFIIFPFSIIVFFFSCLSPIYYFIISFFEYLINWLSKLEILVFIFRKPSMIIVIIYYLVIVLVLFNRKRAFLLLLLLVMHYNINKIIPEKLITYLNVGEGDSIVLKSNNHLFLLDTSGNIYYSYSDNIIKYFKSLGIRKIESLIITHGDFDHMGEAINLVNDFKVEKVIFNCGEYNDLEKELIKVLDKKKINYYSCIKELDIDNNRLSFLQTEEYDNENDNSNVIYTELNGYKFMFMGDASITTEKEIMNKYNLSNIDVLKVGHHGSKTSSSKDFIDEINPRYSVISVGKNNRYGHPNKEVLDNLRYSKIYRTDQDGSIMFKIKNNKLKIETCSP